MFLPNDSTGVPFVNENCLPYLVVFGDKGVDSKDIAEQMVDTHMKTGGVKFTLENVIEKIGVSQSLSLLLHQKSTVHNFWGVELLRVSPHINEILDVAEDELAKRNINLYSNIRINPHVNDHYAHKLIDKGIVALSPKNVNLSADVTHRLMEHMDKSFAYAPIVAAGKVYDEDVERLNVYSVCANPHLPQEMYAEVISTIGAHNKDLLWYLSINDSLNEDNIKAVYDRCGNDYTITDPHGIGFTAVNNCIHHPNMPKDYIVDEEDLGMIFDIPIIDFEKATSGEMLAKMDELGIGTGAVDEHLASFYVTDMLYTTQDIAVFDKAFSHSWSDDGEWGWDKVSDMLVMVRDEVDFLSSRESTALWAIVNSPYQDVVETCCAKYPGNEELVGKNPFREFFV